MCKKIIMPKTCEIWMNLNSKMIIKHENTKYKEIKDGNFK